VISLLFAFKIVPHHQPVQIVAADKGFDALHAAVEVEVTADMGRHLVAGSVRQSSPAC